MTGHTPAPPFAHSSGPRDARIALVGEAFGREEDLVGRPFVGASGQLLSELLKRAGIARNECFLTNVFAARPPDNNLAHWCAKREEVGADYPLPALTKLGYVRREYLGEIERLEEELLAVQPNLVVALGAVALWALARTSAIGSLRGTVLPARLAYTKLLPTKLLPTYHPASIFRAWSHYPIVLADLMKAKRESEFPEIRRPQRKVLVNPALDEIRAFVWKTICDSPPYLATDVETYSGQITMVGFASRRDAAIVIPFTDIKGRSYWSQDDEILVREQTNILLSSDIPKVTQNGLYDIQYFLREGFALRNFLHDTMLLHHSHYPEMPKSLGFMGSYLTSEPAWKLMRKRRKEDELKRDE